MTFLNRRPSRFRVWIVLGAALSCIALVAGQWAGGAVVRSQMERLELLWPGGVLALPEDDRVVLVKAAFHCHLHELPLPAQAADVAACLRAGAEKVDATSDRDQITSSERLEHLLRSAQHFKRSLSSSRQDSLPVHGRITS